ncbi:hypothetical protein GQR58_012257 [Nymphon striatum]|nr:hypothetical protein GQR58_012257 [Nymphon striatum]
MELIPEASENHAKLLSEKMDSFELQADVTVPDKPFVYQHKHGTFSLMNEKDMPDTVSTPQKIDTEESLPVGLPEKYFLPSPKLHSNMLTFDSRNYSKYQDYDLSEKSSCDYSESHNASSFDAFDKFPTGNSLSSESCDNMNLNSANLLHSDARQMTRGEPMGEESENLDVITFASNLAQQRSSKFIPLPDNNENIESESNFSEIESCSSIDDSRQACGYAPEGTERPPLVGQSNDSRGQVASGMSSNSSDVSSSYNSAISSNSKDDNHDIFVEDSLSLKVSILLGNECTNSQLKNNSSKGQVGEIFHSSTDLKSEDLQVLKDYSSGTETIFQSCDSNDNLSASKANLLRSDSSLTQAFDNLKCLESQIQSCDSVNSDISENVPHFSNIEHHVLSKQSHDTSELVIPVWKGKKQNVSTKMNKFEPLEIETNKDISFSEIRPSSPTSVSSVASSKRLEWDSGADIGYKTVTSSSMSATEVEVLQWANNAFTPLTRTEPEGKSFKKEKRKVILNIREIKPVIEVSNESSEQNSSFDSASDDAVTDLEKSNESRSLVPDKLALDSSMTSITSEIFKEVLYGHRYDKNRDLPKSEDDEVIVRVRKLLDQSNRSDDSISSVKAQSSKRIEKVPFGCNENEIMLGKKHKSHTGVHFSSHHPSVKTLESHKFMSEAPKMFSFPEVSPSHSSSSWSVKSSNTVVMTPISQHNDELETSESELNIVQSSQNVYPETKASYPQPQSDSDDKEISNINEKLISVCIQTDSRSELSVPRPIFPRGKSRSLDILPTLMVDAAVNPIYPYIPSSEENIMCYEDFDSPSSIQDQNSKNIRTGSDITNDLKINQCKNCERSEARVKSKHIAINTSNTEIGNISNVQEQHSKDNVTLPYDVPPYDCSPTYSNMKRHSPHGKSCCISEKKGYSSQHERFKHILPYWPSGSDSMYYTVKHDPSAYVYNAVDSPEMMSQSQLNEKSNVNIDTDSQQFQDDNTNISIDGSFTVDDGSKQTSSDISLQTQKFGDRSKWLQEMAQLERKRSEKLTRFKNKRSFSYQQTDSAQSSYHVNDRDKYEWRCLDVDDSLSSCSVSSHTTFKIVKDKKENKNSFATKQSFKVPAKPVKSKMTVTSLQLQIERLKDMIREQRLSSINRLLLEIKKIERLENMIPNLKQSKTSHSPDQSEVSYHMKKSGTHRSAKDNSIDDTNSPGTEIQNSEKSNFKSQKYNKGSDCAHHMLNFKKEVPTRDFCQLFPSPSATPEVKTTSENKVSSFGVQTTPSLKGISTVNKSAKLKKPIGWVIPVSQSPGLRCSLKMEERLTLQEAFEHQFIYAEKLKYRHERIAEAIGERQKQLQNNRELAIKMAFQMDQNAFKSDEPKKKYLTHYDLLIRFENAKDKADENMFGEKLQENFYPQGNDRTNTKIRCIKDEGTSKVIRLYDRLPEVVQKKNFERQKTEYEINRLLKNAYNKCRANGLKCTDMCKFKECSNHGHAVHGSNIDLLEDSDSDSEYYSDSEDMESCDFDQDY